MLKQSLLLILIIIFFQLCACGSLEKVQVLGNTSLHDTTNIVAGVGEFFYAAPAEGIFKINENGEQTMISSDKAYYLNCVDEWLYYLVYEPKFKDVIYKLSRDGKEKSLFMEIPPEYNRAGSILVINNWIYFCSNEGLSRINMKNKGIEPVIKELGSIVGVQDEWIFYQTETGIQKFHLDGSNKVVIYEHSGGIQSAILNEERIYAMVLGKDHHKGDLLRMSLDGTDLFQYDTISIWGPLGWSDTEIRVHDGWIYYYLNLNMDDLRRISIDGKTDEVFIKGRIQNVVFAGDWIFFSDYRVNDSWDCMMKLDKTQIIKLCRFDWIGDPQEQNLNAKEEFSNDCSEAKEKVQVLGNTQLYYTSNIVAGGGEFFYAIPTEGIMKINENGEQTMISTDDAHCLNYVGEWLYYIVYKSSIETVYKLSRDGKEKTLFIEIPPEYGYARSILLINNWIYFVNDKGLFRINMENKEIEPIIRESGSIVGVQGEWVLYGTNTEIQKFHLDGSDKVTIYKNSAGIQCAILDGDWIYFVITGRDHYKGDLLRVKLDGTDLFQYDALSIWKPFGWSDTEICIHDGWIYYHLSYRSEGLRRLSIDGSIDEVFIEGRIRDIVFAEDWIFFSDFTIDDPWDYMMMVDKTQIIKLRSLKLD